MTFLEFKEKYELSTVNHFPHEVNPKPTVSVCVPTYNHSKYIKECLDSIIRQKTDFSFEIILGEDQSSDKTREICLSYAKKYPKIIRLILHKRDNNIKINNVPTGRFNFLYGLYESKGEYIALCEGDDYWIDDNKLQKQVNFLKNNKGYNVATANKKVLFENENKIIQLSKKKQYTFSYEDMIIRNHCSTCNTLIRNFIKEENNLDFVMQGVGSDAQLWLRALGKDGKGIFMEDFFAVYRKNENGLSSIFHKQRNNYKKKKESLFRKIKRGEFWYEYFDKEAKKSIFFLRKKTYGHLIKLAYNKKHIFDVLIFGYKYFYNFLLLKNTKN